MVTLHHFASPHWLAEQAAWETGAVVPLFERYARKVTEALGEQVGLWCTINEPNVFMFRSWVEGVLPPRKKDLRLAFKVATNVLRAHAAAYHAIHLVQPEALV